MATSKRIQLIFYQCKMKKQIISLHNKNEDEIDSDLIFDKIIRFKKELNI